jgi:hypothetical protein
MQFTKHDSVLWLRHLARAGMEIPPGAAAVFRVDGTEILFEPMRPGPDGRPTYGLRAVGANRAIWTGIPIGTEMDLELVSVEGASSGTAREQTTKTRLPATQEAFRRNGALAKPDLSFGPVDLAPSQNAAFDAYIMVDWSASSVPKTGKDSVWWCLCQWRDGRLIVATMANPPTRRACLESLRALLCQLVTKGMSILVAFDFPYGYPAGFATALNLSGDPWRAVWNELNAHVTDNQVAHVNNRFQLAGALNERIRAPEGPFWGHPQGHSYAHLHSTEPRYPVANLARLRVTDRYARRAQPVWKLCGNGSVGSQALLGIPVLAQLRYAPDLRSVSAVWPFETGCMLRARGVEPRIVFAEIYPSIVTLPTQTLGRVKDSLQVEAIARHFARHDADGTLNELFAAPSNLPLAVQRRIVGEEGWILGVTP